MRALRVGKETYAIVAATLRAFATGKHEERIPIYRMLATPLEVLRARARAARRAARTARIVDSRCALGGGTTPTETIASVAIEVPGNANELQARFLRNDPPIVGTRSRTTASRSTCRTSSADGSWLRRLCRQAAPNSIC